MPLPRLAAVLGLAAALLAGCAPAGRFTVPDVPPSPPDAFGRAPDGLLHRPDLQRIVDLQVLRRGDSLALALDHPDAAVRARAAFALGSVQDPDAVPALLGRLADVDARVRADAAFALGQTADSTAAVALLAAYDAEADAAVQRELLDALGKIGGRDALARLTRLAVPAGLEPDWARAVARFGMRDRHDADAVTRLALALTADDPALRERAAYYFGRTRQAAPWAGQAPRVRNAFDAMAPGDPARMHLALGLGRLRDAADLDRLTGALANDPDWRVRTNAARALANHELTDVADALFTALDDPSPHVAVTAAGVLAGPTLTDAQARRTAAWIEAHPTDWQTAAALLPALAAAGRTDAVLAWIDRQASPFARAAGLGALAEADDPASLGRLFSAAGHDDPRLAYAALEALKARWQAGRHEADAPRYYAAFAEALRRRDLATTSSAASALTDSLFRPLGAGALLREVYAELEAPRDLEPMVEILRAAGQVRDGAEIAFLVDAAMAGHPALRAAARDALNDRLVEGIGVALTGEVAPPTVRIEWDDLADLGPRPLLTLFTEHGPIVIEMDAEGAPQTVQRLARTARRGDYDGVPFHRVVPNFVIQGGDYVREDGWGGPDVSLRSELTRHRFRRGTAGMASAGKDTEGVQFFVTHGPTPHLDGRYTAFGRVVAGQDAADRIRQGDVVLKAVVTPRASEE